jgi:hypothetical protein
LSYVEQMTRWSSRGRYPSTLATALTALLAQSCGMKESHPQSNVGGSDNQTSGGSGGGSSSSGGDIISVAGTAQLGVGGDYCPDSPVSPFADQTVYDIGEQRTFYSWTTDEQVAELRAGGELFSRSERPGLGRGLLFSDLAAFAEPAATPEQRLAGVLGSMIFAKQRFAWTNPWATLLGFPGETYGGQLLEIELEPEAWIAQLDAQGLSVFDAQNQPVPIEIALASPERIGAIYYQSSADADSSYCGTFSQGAVGFREFALGNIEMVKTWSLATPEIAQRLQDDIAKLQAFEAELGCISVPDQASWTDGVACDWSERGGIGNDALTSYNFALGLPSELYFPSPSNLSMLIAALEASMPTGEPLVVSPGQ